MALALNNLKRVDMPLNKKKTNQTSITRASPSDCLVSYQDSHWGSLNSLQRCCWCILQPQLSGPYTQLGHFILQNWFSRENYFALNLNRFFFFFLWSATDIDLYASWLLPLSFYFEILDFLLLLACVSFFQWFWIISVFSWWKSNKRLKKKKWTQEKNEYYHDKMRQSERKKESRYNLLKLWIFSK